MITTTTITEQVAVKTEGAPMIRRRGAAVPTTTVERTRSDAAGTIATVRTVDTDRELSTTVVAEPVRFGGKAVVITLTTGEDLPALPIQYAAVFDAEARRGSRTVRTGDDITCAWIDRDGYAEWIIAEGHASVFDGHR